MLYSLTKRLFDVVVAAVGLVLAAPVLLVVAAGAWLAGLRPVLFRQARIGWREQPFEVLKLRSMRELRDPATGELLPDAARLSGYGSFLRATHLDELPQLWHILRGEMSFVGPRPLLPEYLPLYSAEQRTRHRVRPGLTGWAQIHGGNALDWPTRLALDAWYATHAGWKLDLQILARTAGQLLLGRRGGAASAPATRFLGNESSAAADAD